MNKPTASWKPGQSGNPRGRYLGARNILSRQFVEDMQVTWREGGIGALRKVRDHDPVSYCRIVASLLPREVRLESDTLKTVVLDFRGVIETAADPLADMGSDHVGAIEHESEPDPDDDDDTEIGLNADADALDSIDREALEAEPVRGPLSTYDRKPSDLARALMDAGVDES